MAERLQAAVCGDILRVATDGRTITDIAAQIIAATDWPAPSKGPHLEY
jgi:hypothetical protein